MSIQRESISQNPMNSINIALLETSVYLTRQCQAWEANINTEEMNDSKGIFMKA